MTPRTPSQFEQDWRRRQGLRHHCHAPRPFSSRTASCAWPCSFCCQGTAFGPPEAGCRHGQQAYLVRLSTPPATDRHQGCPTLARLGGFVHMASGSHENRAFVPLAGFRLIETGLRLHPSRHLLCAPRLTRCIPGSSRASADSFNHVCTWYDPRLMAKQRCGQLWCWSRTHQEGDKLCAFSKGATRRTVHRRVQSGLLICTGTCRKRQS